jgi:hypothetical protein
LLPRWCGQRLLAQCEQNMQATVFNKSNYMHWVAVFNIQVGGK